MKVSESGSWILEWCLCNTSHVRAKIQTHLIPAGGCDHSDPKKFCASVRSQTLASRLPGEHHNH